MSYEPPDIIDPESEAQQLLAEVLNDRLNTQLTEGLGLSSYDAMRVLELITRELESTDTTHLPATSTYRLMPESRRETATPEVEHLPIELEALVAYREVWRGWLNWLHVTPMERELGRLKLQAVNNKLEQLNWTPGERWIPQAGVQRQLFEEAVRGLLWGKVPAGSIDGVVDEIVSIARDHPPT